MEWCQVQEITERDAADAANKQAKLRMINNSQDLQDHRIPLSSRLEKQSRDLKGFYSIGINN